MQQPRKRMNRAEKKAETRELLLRSAQGLFAQKGYEGTSIDEISEGAGFSRGAFYANFSGKEAIMRALIEHGFEGDLERLNTFDEAGDEHRLADAFAEYARSFYENPGNLLWMLEFQLSVVRHPELREQYVLQHKELRDAVWNLIADQLRTRGISDPEAYRVYADAYITLLSGLSLQKLLTPDDISPDSFKQVFDALWRGMLDPKD